MFRHLQKPIHSHHIFSLTRNVLMIQSENGQLCSFLFSVHTCPAADLACVCPVVTSEFQPVQTSLPSRSERLLMFNTRDPPPPLHHCLFGSVSFLCMSPSESD
ncbi:hypothetical protein GOODEAATRI_006232 [Goodea atripinnis]|uniref:Uncharacterized protein n=1 Tax=Goodea atripinnis TaxID=208336 RepID=A0ABV0PVR1_9TELE